MAGGCRPPTPTLTIPISNWPGYEYFYLAEQRNLGAAEGLRVRTLEFADPQEIVHAYLRGDLSLAQLTTVEAVDICARTPDRCPVVVLVLDESRGADQLVARPGIRSIQELRGQPVAVTQSTLGPYVLSRALEQNGMNLQDVKIRTMPLDAMPAALASGSVQAAALFPPYSDQAIAQAGATRLFDSRAIPSEIFDILVVDPQALPELKASLPKLLHVWQEAHDLRRRQPQQAIPLMARRQRIAAREFEQAELGLRYFPLAQQRSLLRAGGPFERNLRNVQRVQILLRLVKPGSPLPPVSDASLRAALR
ncbi:MAG: ABC transporter substrate-binding protein [Synechococcaceae cyanobacterium]|nr:ABC transporter substrate-binding protein [Synechococcaceae cyanobacterium]